MLLLDNSRLRAKRAQTQRDDQDLQGLIGLAHTATARPVATVMDKTLVPPSGDKHDYMSFGPYWWPNPETPDGLPYVRRDGLLNPDTAQSDKTAIESLMRDIETLALAYFYSSDKTFAEASVKRLRAWFLDAQTRMNPHLQYGQAIPGVCEGRGIGIIDTVSLRLLPDVLEMLQPSESWTAQDDAGMREWMSDYLDWLLHSEHGKLEAIHHNNHGTWYDVQVALLALATQRTEIAREILQAAPTKRFAEHIAPDGKQPHELERTRSFSYSCYNLQAMFDLATLGERVDLDVWDWRGENGASLQRALEFLAPYAAPENKWTWPQVVANDGSQLLELLRRGAMHFPDANWQGAIKNAEKTAAKAARLRLLWPLEEK